MRGKVSKWFTERVKDYVRVRLETQSNKTHIAKEVQKAFRVNDVDLDSMRRTISAFADRENLSARTADIKRLFFDIEKSYCIGWFWQPGFKLRITADQIIKESKIICICYKWQHEDKVRVLKWDAEQDDKKVLEEFVHVIGDADEIVAHNGDKYDMKELRTRCIKHGVLVFPKYRTIDTLKKARSLFNFPSNRLDEIGRFLNVGRKIENERGLWDKVCLENDRRALTDMVNYCMQDVLLLEEIFYAMSPYIDHNTNFAVKLGRDKWACPECASERVELSHTDTTPMGYIKRHMKCNDCRKFFHISNKTYLRYLRDYRNVVEV